VDVILLTGRAVYEDGNSFHADDLQSRCRRRHGNYQAPPISVPMGGVTGGRYCTRCPQWQQQQLEFTDRTSADGDGVRTDEDRRRMSKEHDELIDNKDFDINVDVSIFFYCHCHFSIIANDQNHGFQSESNRCAVPLENTQLIAEI
jgi:hypothetical protein